MDPYSGAAAELFDIPAAEQEITVGSNEQTVVPGNFNSQINVINSLGTGSISLGSSGNFILPNVSGQRHPRVIMLQRSNQGSILQASDQRSGLKTVKIITVPGQGTGGKPLKAAVIPMHMLQRTMKVLPSLQQISSSGTSINQNMPRVLTIRSPGQFSSGHNALSGVTTVTPIRPGTLIFSGSPGTQITGPTINYSNSEDVENHMIFGSNGEIMSTGTHGVITSSGGYYDLNIHNASGGFEHIVNPVGRESGDEQEQVTTGLKTNGLRRYARCVCNKVKEKGITSYSEVADELVHEYAAEHPMIPSEQLHYIQKNIRRRVYDALNVLMALNVLQKEKKEIRWVGLPVNMIEECRRLEEEREKRQVSLRNKTVEIQDLILQLIAFKNLIMRNRINDRYRRNRSVAVASINNNSIGTQKNDANPSLMDPLHSNGANLLKFRNEKIPLPFLVISTHRKTVIDCNISTDKLEYLFNFDQAYEIRDEVDTLKRMGLMLRLGTIHCTQEEYNQCLELVPPSLRFYVEAIYERRQAIVPDFEALHQQRRLFVEARLAAAAAAASHTDENGDPIGSGGPGGVAGSVQQQLDHSLHNNRHSPLDTDSHYGNLFDTNTGNVSDGGLRQLYLNRNSDADDVGRISGVSNSGFVPGDTQHYARAAASRGYVVPGGPGGLLRHRQHPVASNQTSNGISARHYNDGMGRVGSSSLVRSLISDSHNISGTVMNIGSDHPMSHHHPDDSGDDLVDPDEEILDHDDDDDEDDDMEDV